MTIMTITKTMRTTKNGAEIRTRVRDALAENPAYALTAEETANAAGLSYNSTYFALRRLMDAGFVSRRRLVTSTGTTYAYYLRSWEKAVRRPPGARYQHFTDKTTYDYEEPEGEEPEPEPAPEPESEPESSPVAGSPFDDDDRLALLVAAWSGLAASIDGDALTASDVRTMLRLARIIMGEGM